VGVSTSVVYRILFTLSNMGYLNRRDQYELGAKFISDGFSYLYQHIRLGDYPAPAPRNLPELTALIDADRERGWVLHRSDYSPMPLCN
jgi:DNA-binding IclR family transcriptional regulator